MHIIDNERLLIALVLRYGKQAVQLATDVTPDKFIFGSGDAYSREHSLIWNSIINNVFVKKIEPTVLNTEGDKEYLNRLLADLNSVVYEYDPNQIVSLANSVFDTGTAYQLSMIGGKMSTVSRSVDELNHFINSTDLESWMNEVQNKFRDTYNNGKTGYDHVGVLAEPLIEKWERMYAGEQLSILPVGWPTITNALLYPIGQLALLHGMSGVGKTAYLLGTLLGTAIGLKVHGIKGCVAMNSLEMPAERLVSRLASLLAGVDTTRLLGAGKLLTREELDRLEGWARFVGTLPIYLDDNNLMTTDVMAFNASTLHSGSNGPVWQLGSDYTELFKDDDSDNMEQRIYNVVRNQFDIAHSLNCSVIAISQSTYVTTEQSKYKIAGMSGLRYSRGATQAADIIVELWNPPQMKASGIDYKIPEDDNTLDDRTAWLLVQKYRDGGKLGPVRIGWENQYTRFYDDEYVLKNGGQMVTYDYLDQLEEARNLLIKDQMLPTVSNTWDGWE